VSQFTGNDLWRLLDLGAVDGYMMTNMYEAVAVAVSRGSSPNTVILDHPLKPFVNIGQHQLMEKEINVEKAKAQGYSLVRRTIGGGAILDGPWEQDYFVVVRRSDPICPPTIPEFYKSFLKPPLYALTKLGLEPTLRPPNDILVQGKKISGNGAITIEEANVLAGDLLLDAPTALMSDIINAPSEKFRDKLAKSMTEWIISLRSLIGDVDREEVKKLVMEGFNNELGIALNPGDLTPSESKLLKQLIEERKTDKWIFSKDNELIMKAGGDQRATKVRGGISVTEAVHKAGKLIRVVLVSKDNQIKEISLSGDFFTVPYTGVLERLEQMLVGAELEKEILVNRVKQGFEETGLHVIGADQADFVDVILKARPEMG
jgi:lipoate-protein ligase A